MSHAPTWWTPDRVATLEAEVGRWLGTPFAPNSCARGMGVSCQKLAGALYEAAGYPPVFIPDVPISHARFSDRSFVIEFFSDRPDFQKLEPSEPITAGDVLGFRLGRCVHHLGVALNGYRFVHAIDGAGVCIANTQDATWLSRLTCIWRPHP